MATTTMPTAVVVSSSKRSRHRRLIGSCLAHGAVLLGCSFAGYWAMFSQYASYDDEGYHLWVLNLFTSGEPLYNEVFSYYGPLHYELWRGVAALTGITFTTNVGRLVTLMLWLATSLVLGLTAGRLTSRLSLAIIVQVLSFHTLASFRSEPMYPGGTALLLIAVLLGSATMLRGPARLGLFAIGALVGAVLLTKINVGGYLAIAVAYAAVMTTNDLPARRVLRIAASAAFVLVGPAVMLSTFDATWTQRYAYAFVASAIALVLVTWPRGAGTSGAPKSWLLLIIAGGLSSVAVILVLTFWLGSTPSVMFDSIVGTASRQASVFVYPLRSNWTAFLWPTIALPLAFLARFRPPDWFHHHTWIAIARACW